MATETSTVHAALTALQVQLAAQMAATIGYEHVEVASGDLVDDTPREAVLLLGTGDWMQEWAAIGNLRKSEDYRIDGLIVIVKPGAGETIIQAARARAFGIMGVIETYLRMSTIHGDALDGITLQGTVKRATFLPQRLWDGIHPEGRMCLLEFQIAIAATLQKG